MLSVYSCMYTFLLHEQNNVQIIKLGTKGQVYKVKVTDDDT